MSVYGFNSEKDARRAADAIRWTENQRSKPGQRQTKPTGAEPIFARSTGTVVDTEFSSGFVVNFATGTAVDLGDCYLTTIDGEPPAAGIYFGRITGLHIGPGDTLPRPVVRVVSGGDTFGFWAEITGSSGTPLGYSWKRKVMTGPGTWADATEPAPLTGTTDAYRAPSNTDPPAIPTGQVVELRPSLTSPGEYEIHAVGGIQTETFNIWRYTCDGSDLIETEYTVTIKGRDLDVSVA